MLLFKKDICDFLEEEINELLCNMGSRINDNYIYDIASDKENHIVFYSIDNTNDIYNCPSSLIYTVERNKNSINVYILFIATSYRFRKVGYASLFIKEFIMFIKEKYYKNKKTKVKIVLDSILEAVTFYEHYGFKWVVTDEYNDKFKIPEDTDLEHFIMIYEVN
jgi:predicted GNAT family N-acyltransferase